MHAFLPPSSSVTCFSRSAAARAMARPVGTLPISAMRGISGCETSAAPQSAPPVTTLSTPGGTTSPIELHHAIRRQRRLLRRLHDHRVARGERCGHLRGREHQRMVVRDDPGAHAKRLAQRHVDGAVAHRNRLALHFAGKAGEVLELRTRRHARRSSSRQPGCRNSAASISASSPACSRSRSAIARSTAPALGRAHAAPCRKRLVRGARRGIDVGRIGHGAVAEAVPGRGIERRRIATVRALPLAAVVEIAMTRQCICDLRAQCAVGAHHLCRRAVCTPPPVFAS